METYESLQKVRYRSFESSVPLWREGQRRILERWLLRFDRAVRIADVACGDGVGLEWFREQGFTDVVGVEFEPEKAQRARASGYPVFEQDMHALEIPERDVIFSSHTLEHAHNPKAVLDRFKASLVPNGRLLLVLPFPDAGPADAHCGTAILGTGTYEPRPFLDFMVAAGWRLAWYRKDTFREPELWSYWLRPL